MVEKEYVMSRGGIDARIYVLKPDATILRALFSNLVVDNETSALLHLSSRYYIALAEIQNASGRRMTLERSALQMRHEGQILDPILPRDFPDTIHCINWKGNLKNAYNAAVVAATTAFFVAAVLACAKEHNCGALRQSENVLNASRSGETDPEKAFSDPVFRTTLQYSRVVDLGSTVLESADQVSGLVLFRKPALAMDMVKVTTTGNCIVH